MKKGFTLVELLAVIVILSVIAIITVPIIGNVIEESKKKALEQSAYGIIEAADYLALKSNQLEHFTFTSDGVESITENKLDYKGKIDAVGDLYIDEEGDISLCLSNDKYYVYKNYGMNDEVIVGEKKDGNCIAGHDVLTNKYVAMLDNGTGQVSNVYSKDEIDNLLAPITKDITDIKADLEDAYSTALSNQTNIGTLNSLTTTNKTDLVSAINELDSQINSIFDIDYSNVISSNGSYDDQSEKTITIPSNGYIIARVRGGWNTNDQANLHVLIKENASSAEKAIAQIGGINGTESSFSWPVKAGNVIIVRPLTGRPVSFGVHFYPIITQ